MPIAFLRGALFSVGKNKRTFFQQAIFSSRDVTIVYTGFQLSQADLDVWAAILRIARFREHDNDDGVMFSSGMCIPYIREFLRGMGRGEGGQDIKRFVASLTRLQSAVVQINQGKYGYSGNLINKFEKRGELYLLSINPEIAKLFGRSGWTAVEVEQRKKLQKSPLAQWLHGFYSSHRNSEYCYSVKKIRMLCGSTTDDLYGFKRDVKKALQKVEDVTGWECCVLQDDLIQVVKPRRESPMIPTER